MSQTARTIDPKPSFRAIILEVIDDGDLDAEGERIPWPLDHPFESVANEARLRFCDAIERRVRELQVLR